MLKFKNAFETGRGHSFGRGGKRSTRDASHKRLVHTTNSKPPTPPPKRGKVLHPLNLRPVFTFRVDTRGVKRPRRQRHNIKKAQYRPVTNPENRPLRRRKPGVMSCEHVVEANYGRGEAREGEGEERSESDEDEDERSGGRRKRRRTLLVDDEIGGYSTVESSGSDVESIESFSDEELAGASSLRRADTALLSTKRGARGRLTFPSSTTTAA